MAGAVAVAGSMLKVRKDRSPAAISASVGVPGEHTVDDYSRDAARPAVGRVDAADGPAKGDKPGDGVLVESGFGGRAVGPALEATVGAAAAGQPLAEDGWCYATGRQTARRTR